MPPLRALVTFAAGLLAACAAPRRAEPAVPAELQAYQDRFSAAVNAPFGAALDRAEVLQQIRGARVLWLGDTHNSSRLHALHCELLRDLVEAGIHYTLVLEAVGTEDQPAVQKYLEGVTELRDLRRACRARWDGSWLDDPELDPFFYRSLLQAARRTQTPVLALEPTPREPLARRDAAMPEVVRSAAAAHPDRLIVVLVGQAHLVGGGDVMRSTGLPSVAVGGEAPLALRKRAPSEVDKRAFLPAAGMLWFGPVCRRPS
jgi:uncharacterized iron-regulated protein